MTGGKRKCLKIDGKEGISCSPCSTSLSFFKIMLGNFRDVMFIPPKFAHNLDGLVDQNVYLEDLDGTCSKVKVSMIDGSLAFQQGWCDFVLAHSIITGELLIFQQISSSLFSVRIFGISACERVYFGEKDTGDIRRKKREKVDLVSKSLHQPKGSESSENVEGACYLLGEDPGKNSTDMKGNPPFFLPDVEIVETKLVVKVMEEDSNTPRRLGYNDGDCASLETVVERFSEEKFHMVDNNCMMEQESEQVSPQDFPEEHELHEDSENKDKMISIQHLDFLDSERVITKCCPDDKDGHMMDGNSHGRPQTATEAECTEFEIIDKPKSDLAIFTCPLEKGDLPVIGHHEVPKRSDTNLMQMQAKRKKANFKNHDIEMLDGKINASDILDERQNLIEPEKMSHMLFVPEKGTHDIVNENVVDEPEASKMSPAGCCSDKKAENAFFNRSATIPDQTSLRCEKIAEEPCIKQILDCCKDEKGTILELRSKEDTPSVGSIRSAQQDIAGIDIKQGDTCESGIVPNVYREEDEKKSSPTLDAKTFGVVKTEVLDFDDYPLPKSINFSFSLSSTAKSWLELPKSLPTRLKRHERKVIILKDPSMRLWPVLYHESFKFIGFTSGWRAFARANNLQQGDQCELYQVPKESEQVFLVQISKV
ncbi:B3 domain-containing protein Os02g0598200-like isoform X1 [Typha latifolia]|uniref:B3 domain-containing protein Os02g0598200-like isoform X1 n=1 Tax=Typha latifolia TaxID=4733 RepID=UPI003C2DC721